MKLNILRFFFKLCLQAKVFNLHVAWDVGMHMQNMHTRDKLTWHRWAHKAHMVQ